MLSLVVDAILLRDQLVNSGTGLVWKVCLSFLTFNYWAKPLSDRPLRPPGCRDYSPFNAETTSHINRSEILMVQNNTKSRYICCAGTGREHRSAWRSELRLGIQSDTDDWTVPWFNSPRRNTIPDATATASRREWWLGFIFQPGSVRFRDWLLGEPRVSSFFVGFRPYFACHLVGKRSDTLEEYMTWWIIHPLWMSCFGGRLSSFDLLMSFWTR